jgi:ComF family protein
VTAWRPQAEWLAAALQLVFPSHCPACGVAVDITDAWCADCLRELWRPRRLNLVERNMAHVRRCQVLTDYNGAVRTLLHGLKFQRRRANAAPLAWLVSLADEAELAGLWDNDTLAVPVPVSAGRLAERGYNQVTLIFEAWCRRQGIPWREDCLSRRRATLPQWELSRRQRAANIKDAFVVNASEIVRGHSVLLLDDIVTTGRTCEECADALQEAGATVVSCLALAN